MGRVLGIEGVSEGIRPLFTHVVWLNADGMLDTNLVSSLVVHELQPTIVTVPLWVAAYFEGDALLVLEVIAVPEYITDAELQRTMVFVPAERVEVVTDEAVQFIAIVTVTPVARWTIVVIRNNCSFLEETVGQERYRSPWSIH